MIAIFWARPQSFSAATRRALYDMLGAFECERSMRFREAADRDAYIVSHGLLRFAVLAQTGCGPRAWNLSYTTGGQPLAIGGAGAIGYVSISHTRSFVVAACSRTEPIGVDIEDTRRTQPDEALVRASLAPAEGAALLAQPAHLRATLFAAAWTRREAAFKAGGGAMLVRTCSVAPTAVVSIAGDLANGCLDLRQFDETAVRRALQSARNAR